MTDPRPTAQAPQPPRPAKRHRVTPRIEEALGAVAMAALALISISNVIVRYATNASFAFTEEFSVFLLVFLTFVGASLAFAVDSHIRITVLVDRLGRTGRRVADAAVFLATTGLFSLILYYGAALTYDEWYWQETSPGLGYPAWLYTLWLPVLSLAIILRVIGHAVRSLGRGRPASRS